MFTRRKRPRRLLLVSGPDGALFHGGVAEIRLPESVVLALSDEYFQDPAPCEIHRSAVMHRAYEELEIACADGKRLVAALPARLQTFLGEYEGAQAIEMTEGEGV